MAANLESNLDEKSVLLMVVKLVDLKAKCWVDK
jgi:hypothetical protein